MKVTGELRPDQMLFSVTGEEMGVRFVNGEADIRHLKNGVYILKAYRGEETCVLQIVKN